MTKCVPVWPYHDTLVDAVVDTRDPDEEHGLERHDVVHQLQDVPLPVTDGTAKIEPPLLVHPRGAQG